MNSLRLEKSFGIWNAEFTQDRTPAVTGMDRWIDWSAMTLSVIRRQPKKKFRGYSKSDVGYF